MTEKSVYKGQIPASAPAYKEKQELKTINTDNEKLGATTSTPDEKKIMVKCRK